ncbi:malonyl-CoA synthase [Steroidobacter sp. S1-65]|uniref:Malonyl-CoA synthase n=1 Tax=Steroidobacter gossypii TaxID=2805490 RepID=A0ABS1X230_9GAMM|nr:malonyl-CoA synthase [Steroidobacter gossypii]MBM0107303.1 malonyl-CoA synthase [Steroidobacter gossypii]
MSNAAAADDPARWLESVAADEPGRPLLETAAGGVLSYGQMAALTRRLASCLASLQVAPGDRVVAQVEKSPEAVALYLACLQLGAVFVPLNTAYTFAELEYFLGDAAPTLAVVRPADRERIQQFAGRCGVKHVETLDEHGGGSLLQIETSTPAPSAQYHAPSALAALLYTSGTTGRSKGAMLTRANLASNALTLAQAWQFTRQDVLLHALPIFHVHGLFVAINTVLASGSSMLFLPKFDAEQVVRLLPRASVMMGVPTFYTRLLQHPALSRELVANMRLFVSGSAPLLAETHREFQSRTGHAILERYGMSETLMNTSNPYQGERIPGSVGPALPGVEVRIADPETGAVLTAPDAIGMIEVRGPNVFSGYWRMPEKTAAEFRPDGFFITGDLGKRDARGYVYIVGRGKDLIITGGYNVYPVEVELEIDALPAVIESAVIGVPHADFGEAVTAVVVAKQGAAFEEAAVRGALEQRLAKFKVPKRIVVVDELPRNTMGKVQKSALRERFRDLYR